MTLRYSTRHVSSFLSSSSPILGLSRISSFALSLSFHAFLSLDAEARALRRVGVFGGVAALACDSSATKGDNSDDDDAPKLAINILPIDISTFSTPPRVVLFLFVLLLFGVHLGLRGRAEGIRSDDARLCRCERFLVESRRETEQRV